MIRHIVPLLCACALLPACGDNAKNAASPDGGTSHPPDGSTGAVDAPGPAVDAQPTADATGSGGGSSSPEPTPLLDYAFEDVGATVADSSGRALDGTLTGDPGGIWTTGRNGNGLALQNPGMGMAATEYVSLPSGVFTGATDYSVAFWVNLNSNLGWQRIYDFGNGEGGTDTRFLYFTPLGFLPAPDVGLEADYFTAAGGSNGTTATDNALNTQTQFPIGVWKHVVIASTAGTSTIYIDGFPAGTFAGEAVAASELEPLAGQSWLGRSRFDFSATSSPTSDPGLDATLDDFQIYGSALTTDQIAQLALPQKDYTYWRFNETAGTTAADLSSYANTATLVDGVTWDASGRLDGAVALPGGAGKDGSGNVIDGPSIDLAANPLADCTNQLTIAAWVKLGSLDPWAQLLEITTDVGVTGEAWIDLIPYDGAAPHFAMITPTAQNIDLVGTSNPFDDGTGHSDGKWHHLAVTVAPDASVAGQADVTLYADGAVIGTGTTQAAVAAFSSTASPAPMTHFWLGRSRFGDPYLHGSLDELRVSCRAYTGDEIKNLATPAN